MSDMKLQLSSGFAFDYENLFGDGKVSAAEIEALAPDAIVGDMRALTGLIAYHGSLDHQATSLLVAVDVGTASTRAGRADST